MTTYKLNLRVAILALWKGLRNSGEVVVRDQYFHEAFMEFVGYLRQNSITVEPSPHFMTQGAFPYSQELGDATWQVVASGTGMYGSGGVVIGMINFTEWNVLHPEIDNHQVSEAADRAAKKYKDLDFRNRGPRSV